MDLPTYLRVVRARWKTITITTLLVLALVQAYNLAAPKKFSSTAQFFVSTSDSSDLAQLAQGGTFTQQRVQSYVSLLKTPSVLSPVIQKLGLKETPSELAKKVTATVAPNTVLIDATVTASSASEAQRIAAGIARRFPSTIQSLERVNTSKGSPVKVTVVKPPSENTTPVSPNTKRNLLLGLVLGVLLGFGIAIIRHLLDTKVRTKTDIEALRDEITVVGTIPFDKDARSHPLLVQTDPHSSRTEAFRTLRTNLRFIDAANHPRAIVMASSVPGEGKTTTTANLALVLADTGASVCLIEGDLRRPRLLEYLGMEGGVGLTDVLIGQAALIDVLQPFGQRHLAVLGAGQLPPNPSELLGSKAMQETLTTLSDQFDYILIDAPPLLPVTDAAVVSSLTDGVLLVVGSGLVTRDQVNTALDAVEAANGKVLGVALNRASHRGRAATYYEYKHGPKSKPEPTARAANKAAEKSRMSLGN